MTRREVLNKIAKKVDKLIDRELEKYGYERAHFDFFLKCDVLDTNFKKVEEVVLLEGTKSFCAFCHRETYFYCKELEDFICPGCYGALKKVENRA